MLNTIYSLKEVSAYNKMIRLMMHGGQKNKAVKVLLKLVQDKKESQPHQKDIFDKKKLREIVWLGLEKNKIKKTKDLNLHFRINLKYKIKDYLKLMDNAILNVSPYIEVRKVRVSGKTRQIPSYIQKNRQQRLAIRWLIEAAKSKIKKKKNSFSECLAAEILEAADKRGGAIQKRNELHKVAHSNRTFLRYRWW